jgi:hypothetical protein
MTGFRTRSATRNDSWRSTTPFVEEPHRAPTGKPTTPWVAGAADELERTPLGLNVIRGRIAFPARAFGQRRSFGLERTATCGCPPPRPASLRFRAQPRVLSFRGEALLRLAAGALGRRRVAPPFTRFAVGLAALERSFLLCAVTSTPLASFLSSERTKNRRERSAERSRLMIVASTSFEPHTSDDDLASGAPRCAYLVRAAPCDRGTARNLSVRGDWQPPRH